MEQSKKDRMLSKLEVIEKGYLELQARCDKYEKERYEMRLAMRMLLKAFMNVELSRDQEKYYKQADAIFKKYHNITDVLRNEALNGEGEEVENDA